MRIAIDSNRYDDLNTGNADVAALVETAEAVYLPFIVWASSAQVLRRENGKRRTSAYCDAF